jgi:putative acetyltransferase
MSRKDEFVTILPERPDSVEAMSLIRELEDFLEPLYPSESRHGFSVEKLISENVAFFVLRYDGAPAGCGGVKLYGTEYGEIKRIFVRPQYRGRGLSKLIMEHLADYAREQGVSTLRLETGIHQPEAIG